MIIKFVPDLNTELPLSPNARSQSIQLLILFLQHGLVIIVDLLIVEVALLRRSVGIITVREESRSAGRFIVHGAIGGGAVVEADRL